MVDRFEVTEGFAIQDVDTGKISLAGGSTIVNVRTGRVTRSSGGGGGRAVSITEQQAEEARQAAAAQAAARVEAVRVEGERVATIASQQEARASEAATGTLLGQLSSQEQPPVDSISAAPPGGLVFPRDEPRSTFRGRLRDVPSNFVSSFANIFGAGQDPDSSQGPDPGRFLGDAITGFGLITGFGGTRGDVKLDQLPFETRGTVSTGGRVSAGTIGEFQEELILSGGGGSSTRVQNIQQDIAGEVISEFQGKVDTGQLSVEDAQSQADIAFQERISTDPGIKEADFVRGLTIQTGDLSDQVSGTGGIKALGQVGGLILAPQAVGGALGVGLFSSATPDFGIAALGKDELGEGLTLSKRAISLGKGTGKVAIGSLLIGGSLGGIAADVDRESLRFLEQQQIDIGRGVRAKRGQETIDILGGTRTTSSGTLRTDLVLRSGAVDGTTTTVGTGRQTLDFFSFKTGGRSVTTRTFGIGAEGTSISEAPLSGFKSFVSEGTIVPQAQAKISDIRDVSGRLIFPTGKFKPGKLTGNIQLQRFSPKADSFSIAGVSKETDKFVTSISGKPQSLIFRSKDAGKITVSPTKTGLSQEFAITEQTFAGGVFTPRNIGQLRIIDLGVKDQGFSITGRGAGTILKTDTTSVPVFGIEEKVVSSFIKSQTPTTTTPPTTLLGVGFPKSVGGQGLATDFGKTSGIFSKIQPPPTDTTTGALDISLTAPPAGRGGLSVGGGLIEFPKESDFLGTGSGLGLGLGNIQQPRSTTQFKTPQRVRQPQATRQLQSQLQAPKLRQLQPQIFEQPTKVTPPRVRSRIDRGFGLDGFGFPPIAFLGGGSRGPRRKRGRKVRVPTRPSFTGIVLNIQAPGRFIKGLGSDPSVIRGLATGFDVPRRGKKGRRKGIFGSLTNL